MFTCKLLHLNHILYIYIENYILHLKHLIKTNFAKYICINQLFEECFSRELRIAFVH